jgi:hypothetical protein
MFALKLIVGGLVAAALLAAAPAHAEDERETLAVVDKFVTNFGSGDEQAMLSTCAARMTIIDDIPPHLWQGKSACRDWKKAVDEFLRRTGETQVRVMLGKPSHNDVTGDRAYVVVPLIFNYLQDGKAVVDTGSLMTVALRKFASGWRMTGWTCTEHP